MYLTCTYIELDYIFRFWDIFQDVGLPVWYPDQGIKSVCWTLWADNSAICLWPLQPLCYVRSDGSLPYLSLSLSLCCVQCNMWITISICNIYKILHIFRNLCKKRSASYLVDFFFSCYFFFHCIHFNFFFQEKIFENHFLIVFPLKFYIWNPLFIITTKERQLLHMWRKLPHAHNGNTSRITKHEW